MIYHPDPTLFIKNAREYGSLGKTLVALSNLKFAHDNFVIKMHERERDLSVHLSRRFPRHLKEKTNFLVNAVAHIEKLRQVPIFASGELNLLWLQYQLDELYEIRSIIAHGSIFYSRSTSERITWRFERVVQKGKNTWGNEAVEMSDGYLASVHYSASALRHYLISLTRYLDDNSSWEADYQIDKEIRRIRINFAELIALDVVSEGTGWENLFPPLPPIE